VPPPFPEMRVPPGQGYGPPTGEQNPASQLRPPLLQRLNAGHGHRATPRCPCCLFRPPPLLVPSPPARRPFDGSCRCADALSRSMRHAIHHPPFRLTPRACSRSAAPEHRPARVDRGPGQSSPVGPGCIPVAGLQTHAGMVPGAECREASPLSDPGSAQLGEGHPDDPSDPTPVWWLDPGYGPRQVSSAVRWVMLDITQRWVHAVSAASEKK
jgi:hypothetical protein